MADLYGPAASLFKGAADTAVQGAELKVKRDQGNAALVQGENKQITDVASNLYSEDQANKRQQQAGVQNLQALLTQAQAKAQEDRDKFLQDHSFVVSPEYAAGLTKATGVDFSSMAGQRMKPEDATAPAIGLVKAKFMSPKITTIQTENGPMQAEVHHDENGTPVVTILGKHYDAPKGSGKTPEEKDTATLLKIQKDISGAQSKLLTEIKRGNLPDEAFGGEPGNLRKLAEYVSSGQFGNLSPEKKARVNVIKGLLTNVQTLNDQANQIRDRSGQPPVDYTGFGQLQASAGSSGASGGQADVITITDSDGQDHQILRKNLAIAQQRDPGVKVK